MPAHANFVADFHARGYNTRQRILSPIEKAHIGRRQDHRDGDIPFFVRASRKIWQSGALTDPGVWQGSLCDGAKEVLSAFVTEQSHSSAPGSACCSSFFVHFSFGSGETETPWVSIMHSVSQRKGDLKAFREILIMSDSVSESGILFGEENVEGHFCGAFSVKLSLTR